MILVFGSVNVDLAFPVPHWPSPGETVLGGDYALSPGGKGANQALAARRAGSEVALAGAVGCDDFAEIALAGLRRAGVGLELVRSVARPTGCAAILVAPSGENLITVAPGANSAATAQQVGDGLLSPEAILLLQREVPPAQNDALVRRAREAGASVILNLAPAGPVDAATLAEIDYLVANEGEAETLARELPEVLSVVRRALVVTRGAAGATAFLRDGTRLDIGAIAVEPVDTTGAGDAFVGVFAAALDHGLDIASALRWASAAGGLACLSRGAQDGLPERRAIEAALARLPPASLK